MIRFIKKVFLLLKACIGAVYFEYAWDLLSQKKIEKAENKIKIGEKFIKKLPYEYLMMKGQIKFGLEKREECYELFKNAWKEIENDTQLSIEDKNYLKAYMSDAFYIYNKYLNFSLNGLKLVDISSLNLKNVSRHWLKRFPSRDHLDWDKYNK